jgi:hypothetical protein
VIVLPWQELSTDEELHKGVEFGVKAAGEVSKDVWAKATTKSNARNPTPRF